MATWDTGVSDHFWRESQFEQFAWNPLGELVYHRSPFSHLVGQVKDNQPALTYLGWVKIGGMIENGSRIVNTKNGPKSVVPPQSLGFWQPKCRGHHWDEGPECPLDSPWLRQVLHRRPTLGRSFHATWGGSWGAGSHRGLRWWSARCGIWEFVKPSGRAILSAKPMVLGYWHWIWGNAHIVNDGWLIWARRLGGSVANIERKPGTNGDIIYTMMVRTGVET